MTVQLKPLSEQVMVITGASSGIGLATARAAAKRGAKLVLAARSDAVLEAVAAEISAAGGEALAVHCDVGQRDEVRAVAEGAFRRFGRIDTWVNNAGVGIWGRVEEISDADMRQLFETNFWGQVHGALAAIPYLEEQGGALINIGSMASDQAVPLQGVYSASKHAVRGFTDALRMELESRGAPISVTLIKPGSIGTPMPQHIKNYTPNEAKFPPPVYAPEEVAAAILHAAEHPVRDLYVGSSSRSISLFGRVAPRLMDWFGETLLYKAQLGPRPPSPGDNLFHGQAEAKVRGDHGGSLIRPSLYTRARLHPGVTAAVLAGLVLAGASRFGRSRRS
ncbi:SDR family oxidoreductase [Roseomonas sp. BN140053]|uniref:SDR family oxidoreductase n=1 Tax=Roseomonas sp. BN140053 TaxID=3391898 RepID=UPI0039EA3429